MELNTIFDFETLHTDPTCCVVLSLAVIEYAPIKFTNDSYTFEELIKSTKFIKFDVKEQITKYKLKVDNEVIDWWKKQPDEIKDNLVYPLKTDQSIENIAEWLEENTRIGRSKYVFTRGNTFDPVIMENLFKLTNKKLPYKYFQVRDLRSFIEGICLGTDLRNDFIPPECKNAQKHNPIHDVCLDVMRLQSLYQHVL